MMVRYACLARWCTDTSALQLANACMRPRQVQSSGLMASAQGPKVKLKIPTLRFVKTLGAYGDLEVNTVNLTSFDLASGICKEWA